MSIHAQITKEFKIQSKTAEGEYIPKFEKEIEFIASG